MEILVFTTNIQHTANTVNFLIYIYMHIHTHTHIYVSLLK